MEGSESSRSHSKRDVEDIVDGRGSWKEDEAQGDGDDRKTRSGKLRKHGDTDGVEDPDGGRRQCSADRTEPRRKSVSSSGRAYSGGDDDYDVPRDSHISKVPRTSPEERSDRRSSGGYKDRDGVSSRRRGDENEWDSSRRSRGRYESSKGASSYGNRYDSSDSIEIRPNRSLDFGREGSVSGRRTDIGSHLDLVAGTNDQDAENKKNYRNGKGLKDRYYDDAQNNDQNIGQGSVDSPTGKGGSKGPTISDTTGAGQNESSSMVSSMHHQGPKGGRPSRAVRGRSMGRDPQRMGVPVPMMPPPPYGPLGLPPGPIQPMGPNMAHSPSPLGPGIFMPPFPGPLVWAAARGVDMSMLAVPPNLHIPPPVPGSMFGPGVGAGPSHNVQLDQTTGRGDSTNSPVGFNPMGTPSRELLHDKPPGGWTLQRNSGPAGKAPSRGEQNDYSQNFVDTGMRPQNFIRELELTSVVEDYPKLRDLIQRKDEIVSMSASVPMYYKCDLKEHVLSPEFFGTKFDVILVDPPWEEYVHRAPGITDHIEYWSPEEIMNLKIEAIADTPSFIFLWVGDGVGLEQGRQCLKKWGFRRCEDICWVKTNKKNAAPGLRHDSNTLFQRSKEHCLMGIKGTVRRSTDGHIIHANIDTDIIIAEETTDGLSKKPEDMYRIIEHFALGRRRLELFGEDHNIRPGWLTLGKGLSTSNFDREVYIKNFADRDGKVWHGGGGRNPPPDAPHLVVTTPEIENLRPKSPQKNQQGQMGSSSSTNRQPVTNTTQNVVTVVGSETMMPAQWASTPVGGFGMPERGVGSGSNNFDSYDFNAPF